MDLVGQVCIVTGGGSGIGRGVALGVARCGSDIVLLGRTESKLAVVQKEVECEGVSCLYFALDVADYAAVQDMAGEVYEQLGRVDVLVNSAGHSSLNRRLLDSGPDEICGVINSNLLGTIYCTQVVVPYMVDQGEGTILNISSLASVTPIVLGGLAYSAAKAAVNNFTSFVNADLQNTGVRATVIIPGEVETPMVDNRPNPPSKSVRQMMLQIDDVVESIKLVLSLPKRAHIPELVIRPLIHRDMSKDLPKSWERADCYVRKTGEKLGVGYTLDTIG